LVGRSGNTTVPPPETNLSIICDFGNVTLDFFEIPSVLQTRDQLVARLLTLLKKSRGSLGSKLIEALELDQAMLANVLTILPSHWTLAGRVLDRDGKPIANASVQTTNWKFATDENGQVFNSVFITGVGQMQSVVVKAPDGNVIWQKNDVFQPMQDNLDLFEVQEGLTPMLGVNAAPAPQSDAVASEEPEARKATRPRKTAKPRSRAKKET
jgi:hypothetical protein